MIGYTEPNKNRLSNTVEIINEGFILVFTYHMYTFTDWVPQVEIRKYIGYALIVLAVINLVLNIYVATRHNITNVVFKAKLKYKRRNKIKQFLKQKRKL